MICSFFGHRRVPGNIGELLEREIEALIDYYGGDITFYVGDKGQFDRVAQMKLAKIKEKHPETEIYVILDTIPESDNDFNLPTVLPDGIERVPGRFAMSYRNRWMIDKCEIAIVYFTDVASNTRKHVDLLRNKNKTVINIADMHPFFLDNPISLC